MFPKKKFGLLSTQPNRLGMIFAMAVIGQRANLPILHEKSFGLYLDGGVIGEILLPRREVPTAWARGDLLDVFLYLDSEDRQVATLQSPRAYPGHFARLKCVAVTNVGAFLDWGLPKDLLVPFREQKTRMEEGRSYLVFIMVDEHTGRLIATGRLARHMNLTPHIFRLGQEVDLIVFGKSELGYKAIINHTHSGLIYANDVFQDLRPGEALKGYIAALREDGKIDLTLHLPGREKVDHLETQILNEIKARGGFWSLGDHSPVEEINQELGVSKRTFKQATGALWRKRLIDIEKNGIRLVETEF